MNTEQSIPMVIPMLELPSYDYWNVSVNLVISVNEIWARIVNDSVNPFCHMTEKMKEFYDNHELSFIRASIITPESYYAVYKNKTWYRTYCKEFDERTSVATLFFIDNGNTDVYPWTEVFELGEEFYTLPAQALRLRLSGLEFAYDSRDIINYIKHSLLGRDLYVEEVSCDRDENGPIATVVFYDRLRRYANVNLQVMNFILSTVASGPKFDTNGQLHEVFISHVGKSGDVYVQTKSEFVFNSLDRLLPNINVQTIEACAVTTVQFSKIYLALLHGNWYRAKVLNFNFLKKHPLRVLLIDVGKTVTTDRNRLLDLELLSELLAKCPAQAKRVRIPESLLRVVAEFVPKEETMLMKVESCDGDVPCVTLFERIRSIHDNSDSRVESDETKRSLKPPQLPGLCAYFKVYVTSVLNPDDFIVQPLANKRSLSDLMVRLQDVCQNYRGPALTSVERDQVYAGRDVDGCWYRVHVLSIIRKHLVYIYLCDFGRKTMVRLSELQTLNSEFLELPYQAVRARCAGIRPVNSEWTDEDALRFQELVKEKILGSIIVSISNDRTLELRLITTPYDIHLDSLLVEESRAIFV